MGTNSQEMGIGRREFLQGMIAAATAACTCDMSHDAHAMEHAAHNEADIPPEQRLLEDPSVMKAFAKYLRQPPTSKDFSDEIRRAHELHFRSLLRNAVIDTQGDAARPLTQSFCRMVVPTLIWNCMDERAQALLKIGYPYDAVYNVAEIGRTDGSRIAFDGRAFRDRFEKIIILAQQRGVPALFIPKGHFSSTTGDNCAAHGNSYDEALKTVMEDAKQAQALDRENVVCIPGMLETDFKFVQYFYDGKPLIDTQKLAEGLGINGAMDAYADQFLTSEIGDSTANRYLGRVKGETLFQGERPDMYNNLVKTIAMEELSLRRILEARRRGDASNGVYKDKLVQAVHEALSKLPPLPPEVRATLEHQLLWNVAYGAQQKAKVGAMDPVEAKRIMGHTALGVKYGEGFVTVEPGEALVVKEGRENDAVPLGTARKVLQKVRAHTMPNDKLPLLVHVNSKTAGGITNEPSLRTQVGSRIATMQLFVREAFEGTDFNVMKTFSTEHDNLWIPTNQGNGASTFPIDMTHGMNGADFSIAELHAREMLYRDNMAFVGKISEGILAKK